MPPTEVVIFQEKNGTVPVLEWLDTLSPKVQDKCIAVIEKLEEKGYELRRPHCDYLEQGIYELRTREGNVQYRILYGFVGENIVLLSHGCFKKKKKVPKREIQKAKINCDKYTQEPEAHTFAGEL